MFGLLVCFPATSHLTLKAALPRGATSMWEAANEPSALGGQSRVVGNNLGCGMLLGDMMACFVVVFWATPCGAQGLLSAGCLGITPGCALRTMGCWRLSLSLQHAKPVLQSRESISQLMMSGDRPGRLCKGTHRHRRGEGWPPGGWDSDISLSSKPCLSQKHVSFYNLVNQATDSIHL